MGYTQVIGFLTIEQTIQTLNLGDKCSLFDLI